MTTQTDKLLALAAKARELQRKNYGCGIDLHMDMIDWAAEYDRALAQPAEAHQLDAAFVAANSPSERVSPERADAMIRRMRERQQPAEAVCDHRWVTDGIHPTACTRCGVPAEAAQDGDGYRAATPEESAAIDESLGLVQVTMRFPASMIEAIDAGAADAGLIRVAMIRRLVEYALSEKPAHDAAQGAVACWRKSRGAVVSYWTDGDISAEDFAKLTRAGFAIERAYTHPQAAPAQRDREADRQRFSDPDFNRWLDEGISDGGHTVYDAVGDVQAAWQGWSARGSYSSPSYESLLIIAQSVCGALERAGMTDCDDPGEAIDVIRERLNRRIAELEAAPAQGGDETAWREGWAMAYCGAALYGDDGELQDNRTFPPIDFRHDSAMEIRRKIHERGMRALAASPSPEVGRG